MVKSQESHPNIIRYIDFKINIMHFCTPILEKVSINVIFGQILENSLKSYKFVTLCDLTAKFTTNYRLVNNT